MGVRVRSTRTTRLLIAAAPMVGISLGGVSTVVILVRGFDWFSAVLLVVCVAAAIMASTIFRMQLRTERRLTTGMVEKYGVLRQLLAEHGEQRMLIAREANVVILPSTEVPVGFVRLGRDEVADLVKRRDPAATLVSEEFQLDDDQPLVTHRLTAVAPYRTDDTVVPGLVQDTSRYSLRSPRGWWRGWQLVWSINRSGINVPSEHELDELIDQIRSAA